MVTRVGPSRNLVGAPAPFGDEAVAADAVADHGDAEHAILDQRDVDGVAGMFEAKFRVPQIGSTSQYGRSPT